MRSSHRFNDNDRIPQAGIVRLGTFCHDGLQQSTSNCAKKADSTPSAPRYAGLGVLEDIDEAFAAHGARGARQGSLAPTLHRSVLPLLRWLRKNPCYRGRYGQIPKAKLHALMAQAGIARSTRYDHLAHLRKHGLLRDLPAGMAELPSFNDPDGWAHHAQLTQKKTARMRGYRAAATGTPHPQKVRDSDCAPHRTPQNPSFNAEFGMWCQSYSIGLRPGDEAAEARWQQRRADGFAQGTTRFRQPAAAIDHQDPAWLATLDAIAAAGAAAPLGNNFTKTQQPAQRAAQGAALPPACTDAATQPVVPPTQVIAPQPLPGASAPVGPVKKLPMIHKTDPAVVRHTANFTAMFPSHVQPVSDEVLLAEQEVTPPPPPARAPKQQPAFGPLVEADVREFNKEHGLKLCWGKIKHLNLTFETLLAGVYNATVIAPGNGQGPLEARVVHSAKQGWGMRRWRKS